MNADEILALPDGRDEALRQYAAAADRWARTLREGQGFAVREARRMLDRIRRAAAAEQLDPDPPEPTEEATE